MNTGRGRGRVIAIAVSVAIVIGTIAGAGASAPANGNFQQTWARTDQPVLDGQVSRTWMWGPEAFTSALSEPYAESPGGQRTVQYYDKARMEITHPEDDPGSVWYVTNGLLVVELVTGRMQVGDTAFEDQTPAEVNVAGDADDPDSPTYASFGTVLDAAPHSSGATITQRIARDGTVTDDPSLAGQGVSVATIDDVTDHSIAAPFWEFMNSSGVVYQNGQFVSDTLFQNPYFATGRPITEPYWANVAVAGSDRLVLMQCFERRCLTYTPGNPPGFVTEAGNVGQHYYQWRYQSQEPPVLPTPTPPAGGNVLYHSNLADWPAVDSTIGDQGYPGSNSYHIENIADSIMYAYGGPQFTDARVQLDVRRVSGSGDGLACLVTRGTPQFEFLSDHGYQLCVIYSQSQLIGASAGYWWNDSNDDLQTTDFGTWELPVQAQSEWVTLEVRMQGTNFEFYVGGNLLGSATHTGSAQGQLALLAANLNTTTPSDTEFTNLIVSQIGGDGQEPPSAPSPEPTPTPVPPDNGTVTFGGGTQVVGEDIQAGTYRNSSSSDGCYWERLSGFSGEPDDIIANNIADYRQVVTISSSDTGFNSDRCGTWTSDLSPITESPTAPFGDGMWIVGTDIEPGTWRNDDSSESCYWARLSGFGGRLDDIIGNEFTEEQQVVTIQPGDAGFTSSGCGTWTRIGN